MYDRSDPMFMKPLAPLVLPAVYDDVLSYEEWLAKVIQAINDIREYINSTIADIDALVTSAVDTKTADLQTQINTLKASLTTLQSQVNNLNVDEKISDASARTLSQAKAYADAEIRKAINALGNIDAKIAQAKNEAIRTSEDYTDVKALELSTRIAQKQAELTLYVNQQIAMVTARIDDIIKEYPRLYDPATGKTEDMQTLIFNMFGSLRYFGAKAYKYDNQELTADEYDGRCLSAEKYDLYFDMLVIRELFTMFDPFTGEKSSIRDVLAGLVRRLQWNGKTSAQFDGFQATAGEIDASTFNAYEQDTNQYITGTTPDLKNKAYENYTLLVANPVNNVQYEHDVSATYFQFDFCDRTYRFPTEQDLDITISYMNREINVMTINNAIIITGDNSSMSKTANLFAITPAKDVTELDK